MRRFLVPTILLFSFIGLSDNLYLARQEAVGDPLLCTVQNFTDCNVVASSPYSYLFGIPVAYFGVALFSLLFGLALLELFMHDYRVRRALQVVALGELLLLLASTIVQFVFIKAWCIYCLFSSAVGLCVVILASRIEPLGRSSVSSGTAKVLTMPPV